MSDDLDRMAEELQEALLEGYSQEARDEFLHPRNVGRLDAPDGYSKITGVCGDTVEMYLSIAKGKVTDAKFMTDGCGSTVTCASYVTRLAKGRTPQAASGITPEDVDGYFGGLPEESRHCAVLAVSALRAAIENYRRSGDPRRPS